MFVWTMYRRSAVIVLTFSVVAVLQLQIGICQYEGVPARSTPLYAQEYPDGMTRSRTYERVPTSNGRIPSHSSGRFPTSNGRITSHTAETGRSNYNARSRIQSSRLPTENYRLPAQNERLANQNGRIPIESGRISGGEGIPVAQPDQSGTRTYSQQCPSDNFRVLVDGMECHVAINRLGNHICYNHRIFRSRRCCELCLQIKNYQNQGCEYGDRSRQCTSLTASQCYIRANRQICCDKCERLRNPALPNCEYGDMSTTCVHLHRGLCAVQENQRICCRTCERMRDPFSPDCPFGDRASQCGIITGGACYNAQVRASCCSSCARFHLRVSGCEYGDHNSLWSSPVGDLDCETYMRVYGSNVCADPNFSRRCCQSCRQYIPRRPVT